MRKLLLFLLMLCLPVSAMAQETAAPAVTANAVAECRYLSKVTAPCSGVLQPFEWKTGEEVSDDDTLFVYDTIKLCAPADGTVGAVFIRPGQLAEDVMSQYGSVMSLIKDRLWTVEASTAGAYNDEKNRTIHVGDKAYFCKSNDRDTVGEGIVIGVSGKNYTVEMTMGDFEDGNAVKLYRDESRSSKSCIGTGSVKRVDDVLLSAAGRAVKVCVSQGEHVKQGDVLLELLSSDAPSGLTSCKVQAESIGVLELCTVSGAQVYKGQLLAKVHDLSEMCVVASVDEMDLGHVTVGETVTIVFDRYPEETVMGTVRSVSKLGVSRQNAAYYDVTIDYTTSLPTLPGMNATVRLTK